MKRVLVIGCGGSGKTVISRAIASRLGLPLIHLDAEHYDPQWHPLERELFAARQRQLVSGTQWVIEGNYAATLAIRLHAADTLVILDLPARTCVLGIVQRRLKYRGGQHADGVFDRVTWEFLRYVVNYRRRMRPRIEDLVAEHGSHLHPVVLVSRRRANRWLRTLGVSVARDATS